APRSRPRPRKPRRRKRRRRRPSPRARRRRWPRPRGPRARRRPRPKARRWRRWPRGRVRAREGSRMLNVRVFQLARDLDLSSQEVIDRLKKLGVDVKTASSSIDEDTADKRKRALKIDALTARKRRIS